jgi:hypothetical protein
MARPKKWDELNMPDKLILVEGWVRDGLTDNQICENLGIGKSLLYEWKNDYVEFAECFKRGREVADYLVENAMMKSALGYSYDEVTVELGVETKRVTKEVQPNITAQIFWLKNRRSDKWRDKPDAEERYKKLIALLGKLNLSPEEVDELVNSL